MLHRPDIVFGRGIKDITYKEVTGRVAVGGQARGPMRNTKACVIYHLCLSPASLLQTTRYRNILLLW